MSETTHAGAPEAPVSVSAMSEDQQVAALAALLDPDPAPAETAPEIPATEDAPAGEPTAEGEESAAAPEEAPASEKEETEAEAEQGPPIEPPVSWSKDAREHFSNLPRAVQEVVAEREKERESHVSRVQQEAATARKAAEAEAQRAAQERAYYAQALQPLVAEAQQRLASDLSPQAMAQLAQTDPAAYVARVAERDALVAKAQAAAALQEQQQRAALVESQKRLMEAMPEWQDPAKFAEATRALRSYAERVGFTQDDMDGITDHRALVVLEKARRHDELMAKVATKSPTKPSAAAPAKAAAQPAPAKTATQPASRTIAPAQRADSDPAANVSRQKLLQVARRGSADDQVAALARFFS